MTFYILNTGLPKRARENNGSEIAAILARVYHQRVLSFSGECAAFARKAGEDLLDFIEISVSESGPWKD